MKSIQFLTNRNGTYYFRRVVPISLRSILERREIVLSLKTDDFKDACMATLEMSKELDGLFDRLRQGVGLITPPEQDIFTKAVKTHRTQELLREALETFNDRKIEDIEWEAQHCRTYRQEILADLKKNNLQAGENEVDSLLDDLSIEVNVVVLRQLQRAAMKGLADFYVNAEMIVNGDMENPLLWQKTPSLEITSAKAETEQELMFEAVFRSFLADRTRQDGTKQLASIESHYRYFMRFLTEQDGVSPEQRPLSSVSSKLVRDYKEHLRATPSNLTKKYPNMTTHEAVKAAQLDGAAMISDTTQEKYLQDLSTIFNYAINEMEYPKINPFKGKTATKIGVRHARNARLPLSEEQLKVLFSSPLFTGCKSLASCHRTGNFIPKDSHKYWVPLIGLCSGMREQEVLQLHCEDLFQYKNIWVFSVNSLHEDKRLKTPQSERRVPIHIDLIELGLLQHLKNQRSRGHHRLFPDAEMSCDGTYSSTFSKWFSRYLTNIGIKTKKTCFHSFRHNIKDNFRDAGEDGELSEHFCGRKTGSTAERYGSAYSIERFDEALHKLQFNYVQGLNKENKTCT